VSASRDGPAEATDAAGEVHFKTSRGRAARILFPVISLGHVVDEGAKLPLGRAKRGTIELRTSCGDGDARDGTFIAPLSRHDTFSEIAHQPVDGKRGGTRGGDLERGRDHHGMTGTPTQARLRRSRCAR
jgi:hypothetical protein